MWGINKALYLWSQNSKDFKFDSWLESSRLLGHDFGPAEAVVVGLTGEVSHFLQQTLRLLQKSSFRHKSAGFTDGSRLVWLSSVLTVIGYRTCVGRWWRRRRHRRRRRTCFQGFLIFWLGARLTSSAGVASRRLNSKLRHGLQLFFEPMPSIGSSLPSSVELLVDSSKFYQKNLEPENLVTHSYLYTSWLKPV